MGLYRRSNSMTWWLSYSVAGRQFRESSGTTNKRLAEELLRKRKLEVFEGRHFPSKRRGDLTIPDLRDMWLDHAAHKKSLRDDKQRFEALVELLGPQTRLSSLVVQDIAKLRRGLKALPGRSGKGLKPATVNRYLALLQSAVRLAQSDGYPCSLPVDAFKKLPEANERDRICSPEEYETLIDEAYPKLRIAIVLAYHTGMRLGEIASLQWHQIDLKKRTIQLRSSDTKTGRGRTIPINADVVAELKQYPRNLDGDLIDVEANSLSPTFTRLCKRVGIKDLHFHDLRHTAATNLRRAGVDVFTIQKITGHKSLDMLKRYNTIDIDDLKKAVEKAWKVKR